MPHRPPGHTVTNIAVEQDYLPVQPGLVITKVGVIGMDAKPFQEFKPLTHQTSHDTQRPNTAQGVVKTPRRQSFSRPLTSEGPRQGIVPVVPKLPPKPILTQHLVSDPGKIGLAVGSPTQWSANSPGGPRRPSGLARRLPRANTDNGVVPSTPGWVSSEEESSSQPMMKRWRSVGGLFKKKKNVTATAPTTTAAAPTHAPAPAMTPQHPPPKREVKPQKGMTPPGTILEEEEPVQWPTRKSSIRPRFRSKSINKSGESKSCMQRMPRKPVPSAKRRSRAGVGPWSDFQEQVRKRGSKPQLDVTIPDTCFERYSVMFGDLLKQPSNTKETSGPAPTAVSHVPIGVSDSLEQQTTNKTISNRDRPIGHAADFDLLRPVPKIDTGARSPGSISSIPGTPKSSYSLFPAVRPPPSPLVNTEQQPQLSRLATSETPFAPVPTPKSEAKQSPTLPRNHIISQHVSPVDSAHADMDLHMGLSSSNGRSYNNQGPSPLGYIEPRQLRSPDFSPDSPVTMRSSFSSTWSSRPSISHSHSRSKSSGAVVGSPGPSISSYLDTYHTPLEEEDQAPLPVAAEPNHMSIQQDDQAPIPVTAHPMAQLSRSASLRSHPMRATRASPQLELPQSIYEGPVSPISPQVATAKQVAMSGTSYKPQMLARTSSRRNREDALAKVKLNENPSRAASPKMVLVDNSDKPDEDEWIKRRSVWGVIEEGSRVGA